jgi:hypothetical protein
MGDTDTPRPRKTQGSVSSVLTPPTGLPSIEDIAIPAQRAPEPHTMRASAPTAPPVAPPPPVQAPPGTCVCGHAAEAHEHYRAGSDCGACGVEVCEHYRAADAEQAKKGLLSKLLRR